MRIILAIVLLVFIIGGNVFLRKRKKNKEE